MYNNELVNEIRKIIEELKIQSKDIISSSRTLEMASNRIMEAVSARIAAEAEGFVIDLYSDLVDRIKKDEFFKNPEHLNAFYRLGLREKMSEKYQFDIKNLNTYKVGIKYEEINSIYKAAAESAGVAIGTIGLGAVLKYTVLHNLSIPIVIIVAAAVGTVFFFTYAKKNTKKKDYLKAVDSYLNQMENDILDWLTDIDNYFEEQVRSLYKSL